MSDNLQDIYDYIDKNEDKYVQELKEWVAIQSVSNEIEKRPCVATMINTAKEYLVKLGATCEMIENPENADEPGQNYPPILLGTLGNDSRKKTLLVYGHLDVMPASAEDGWVIDDPFIMEEIDGKLYGRGTTDDKGPVLGWLGTIQAYQQHNKAIPVNMKFCFEGMEEAGGAGLEKVIADQKETFFSGVDFVCISDNYWLGKTKPCLTYGLRGIVYFHCKIKCADQQLHSGVYGGTVYEAMTDLIHIFDKLVDAKGRILIPGVNKDVDEMTDEERATYDSIEFDIDEFQKDVGTKKLLYEDKPSLLQHRWRYPSLSFHGINGAYSGDGAMTVIPNEIIGKFSIRLVPSQDPAEVSKNVQDFIQQIQDASPSGNDVDVAVTAAAESWLSDFTHPNYTAGENAMRRVYKQESDLTREGGSIPVTITIQEATETNVMLLPIGTSDDQAHSTDEKMNRVNFVNGMKVFAAYLDELGNVTGKLPKTKMPKKFKSFGLSKKTCCH